MNQGMSSGSPAEAWARLRFAVIGRLLAAPPKEGELQQELKALASRTWRHPITIEPTTFGVSTIERWFYVARGQDDPVGRLQRKPRKDSGTMSALTPEQRELLRGQYRTHPRWTYKLHFENLCALCRKNEELDKPPSYSSVKRYMKSTGLLPRKNRRSSVAESATFDEREVRSFEVEHPNGLWHLDFHHGRKKVLTSDGSWETPILLAVLDDYSRLCCHAQWYLAENTETLVHGFCQAIQKRGLPRMLLNDNGGPMISAEFVDGLVRLGIEPRRTLSHAPYQNGKQETWFGRVEGRLIPMLEAVDDLSLKLLNDATAAWFEADYNRKRHSELAMTPLARFLAGDDVGRESPTSEVLRDAFRTDVYRKIRRSDATITIDGHRFELPSHLRNLDRVRVRYARWNYGNVHLIDKSTGDAVIRIYPVDKQANADGRRRIVRHEAEQVEMKSPFISDDGVAPLLREMLEEYAATGMPPAYIPWKEDHRSAHDEDEHEETAS